jgi:Fe(3+) dicitrate transport protein
MKHWFRSSPSLALLAAARAALAQDAAVPADAIPGARVPLALPKTVVRGESDADGAVAEPFPQAVEGTKVYSGKKVTVLDLDSLPQIQTDNYRQAFSQIPGLLVSELSNASLLSLGYRGIGDPHESQNLLVLKDGLPFVVDLYGYPTVYYAPPFEAVDRLEFIRGGASLMYGPQPSGALNYVTHLPRRDRPFAARTQHVLGSYGLYSTHSLVDGTVGKLGYLVSFDHRQGDSFRRENSDFELNGGSVRLVYDVSASTRWLLDFDATSADSGEPGGLTLAQGAGLLNYDADRRATQLRHDRVRVQRYVPSLGVESWLGDNTLLTARAWGGYYERYSKRQRTGGGSAFGAVGNLIDSNTINTHRYYTFGAEGRLRRDWEGLGGQHTLVGGVATYVADAPFEVDRGATADADTGAARQRSQRDTVAGSVFAENVFRYGRLSLTPGFRLENIHQAITETLNLDKTASPLLEDSYVDHVPLVALGAAYEFARHGEFYGNVSQGYKAKTYADAVPLANNTVVSENLNPGGTWTYEAGLRGRPGDWWHYDLSVFLIDYHDRFGSVTRDGLTRFENVGRSLNRGVDAATEVDLIGLADRLRGTDAGATWGALSLYGNVSLLDAEFVSGPLDGRTPQYAPDYILRTGLIYRLGTRAKVAVLGTFVDAHYANDNNTAEFRIPSYMVWDLTAEYEFWKDHARLFAGLNNALDEDYWSRVRANGIDPAIGRNVYAGLSLAF